MAPWRAQDPLSHPEWGQRLSEHLLAGTPVVYEGPGFGAYGRSDCVDAVVDDYFLEYAVPVAHPVCS
ncbi:hypothetical protein GCM10009771_16320 [Nesterenkonia flava]